MRTQYLEKLRELCGVWEGNADAFKQTPPAFEGVGMEAFLEYIKSVPRQQPIYHPERSGQLKAVVDNFEREELAEFFEAALLESPELTSLPLFEVTKAFSAADATFDWLMDLSYGTLAKASATFEVMFERALTTSAYGDKGAMVMQKIMAITARNHVGLPFGYLRRKLEASDLNPELRLRIALLILRHQDCHSDIKELTALFNVHQYPWLLPAQMEAHLPLPGGDDYDREKAATQAFRALEWLTIFDRKNFLSSDFGMFYPMITVLESILRVIKRAYRSDWEERLKVFYNQPGFYIVDDGLRAMVEEALSLKISQELVDTYNKPDMEKGMEPVPVKLTFEKVPTEKEIEDWTYIVSKSKEEKQKLIADIVSALRNEGELAAANMRPLLENLKQVHISIENELHLWGIALTLSPAYEIETANMHYRPVEWALNEAETDNIILVDSINRNIRQQNAKVFQSTSLSKALALASDFQEW